MSTSNLLTEVTCRINLENQIATAYWETRLDSHRLLSSKLVGVIKNLQVKTEIYYPSGTHLFNIKYLGNEYNIVSENSGKIRQIYIANNQLIMYGSPLIMLEKSDQIILPQLILNKQFQI